MKKQFLLLFSVLFLQEAQAQKLLFTAPLGVQSYTFRKHWANNVEGVLDTIKMFGITELEGGVPRGTTAEAFKKLCDERGIKIPSIGGDYNQLLRNPDSIADIAQKLGAKFVMCSWIGHKRGAFSLENAKKAVEDFNKIGKALNAKGLTFCYHAHGFEFQKYNDGTLLDYIIQNTTPQYVSFEMDVLWIMHGGGSNAPIDLLKKYKKRWKLMHVKDLRKGVVGDLTGNTPAENDVVLGEGQANFPEILKLAKKYGIEHFFIEDESNLEMANVPKSIAYLKGLKK